MIGIAAQTSALFDSAKQQVFAATNTTDAAGSVTQKYWVPVYNMKGELEGFEVKSYTASWPKVDKNDTISEQLAAMNDRCNTEFIKEEEVIQKDIYGNTQIANKQESYYKKWADAWSAETETTIISNFRHLVERYSATAQLVNNELTCLGSAIGTISAPTATIEDVGAKIVTLFNNVVSKITQLDVNYIKKEELVNTDVFIIKQQNESINWKRKAERIAQILDSDPLSYNIAYIEN